MNNRIYIAAAIIATFALIAIIPMEETDAASESYSADDLYYGSSTIDYTETTSVSISNYADGEYRYFASNSSFTVTAGGSSVTVTISKVTFQGSTVVGTKDVTFSASSPSPPPTPTTYTYYLYYSGNGGSNIPSTQSYSTSSYSATYPFSIPNTTPTKSGSTFSHWSGSDGNTYYPGGSVSVPADSSVTLTAQWLSNYTIGLSVPNSATGCTATISGGGQSQTATPGNSASITVPYGTTITYTASPGTGYSFGAWSQVGGSVISSTNPYSETVTSGGYVVMAQFSASTVYYTVGLSVPAAATGCSATLSDGVNTITVTAGNSDDLTVQAGTSLTFTASPGTGYNFGAWSQVGGSILSSSNPYTMNANGSYVVMAQFTNVTYTVGLSVPNSATGCSATLSDGVNTITVTAGNSDDLTVIAGTALTFTATAGTGYNFGAWTQIGGSVLSSSNPYTMNANGSYVVMAQFNVPNHTVLFITDQPGYGDFQPVDSLSVPYGSTLTIAGSQITLNNVNVTAVPSASDGTYNYSFSNWNVNDGDVVTSDMTIKATFTRSYIINTTHWDNGMMNGKISFVFNWGDSTNQAHNMTMKLYEGVINSDYSATWTDTGYALNISASYPNTVFAFDLQFYGSSVLSDTVTSGKWPIYELTIDTTEGKVSMVPVKTFMSFVEYTTLDTQRTDVFDFSSVVSNAAVSVIDHEDTGAGDHVQFSVTNTDVFLNTYGVVMNNPSINVYNHFPQYDKVRVSFYAFALYGNGITVNNTTFAVTGSNVTISYVKDNWGNNVLPSAVPGGTVESKTLDLNNIQVTWDGSHCFLTFVSDRFTIDLGAYAQGNETVSFNGFWYFTSAIYEPSTSTSKELGPWKVLPDLNQNQMVLIFLGLLVLVGAGAYIKLDGSIIDATIIAVAGLVALLLLG